MPPRSLPPRTPSTCLATWPRTCSAVIATWSTHATWTSWSPTDGPSSMSAPHRSTPTVRLQDRSTYPSTRSATTSTRSARDPSSSTAKLANEDTLPLHSCTNSAFTHATSMADTRRGPRPYELRPNGRSRRRQLREGHQTSSRGPGEHDDGGEFAQVAGGTLGEATRTHMRPGLRSRPTMPQGPIDGPGGAPQAGANTERAR